MVGFFRKDGVWVLGGVGIGMGFFELRVLGGGRFYLGLSEERNGVFFIFAVD